jgi:hypothetical protein
MLHLLEAGIPGLCKVKTQLSDYRTPLGGRARPSTFAWKKAPRGRGQMKQRMNAFHLNPGPLEPLNSFHFSAE